jgi:hypothetical protein
MVLVVEIRHSDLGAFTFNLCRTNLPLVLSLFTLLLKQLLLSIIFSLLFQNVVHQRLLNKIITLVTLLTYGVFLR